MLLTLACNPHNSILTSSFSIYDKEGEKYFSVHSHAWEWVKNIWIESKSRKKSIFTRFLNKFMNSCMLWEKEEKMQCKIHIYMVMIYLFSFLVTFKCNECLYY